MINAQKVVVALLGDSVEINDWRDRLKKELQAIQQLYADETCEVVYTETLNPSMTPFLPLTALGSQAVDLLYCREQLLAASADIVVVADSGVSSDSFHRHLDRLERNSKVLVLWSVSETSPRPIADETVGIRPGVLFLDCSLAVLASCLYYLIIQNYPN